MNLTRRWAARCRRLCAWAIRSWPITLPVLALIIWWLLAYKFFPAKQIPITRWTSVLMQVIGGFIVLWSINANFGLIRAHSLWHVVISYFRDFPWNPRKHTVNAAASQTIVEFSQVAMGVTRRAMTTEERIAKLEADLKDSIGERNRLFAEVTAKIDAVEKGLRADVNRQAEWYSSLESRLDEISIGGFKGQLFGALLACSGAVLGALV